MARRRPRILVTGIAGFGGRHLTEHLVESGYEVVGLDHPKALAVPATARIPASDILPCDLVRLGPDKLEGLIGNPPPAAVYHLAAIASVHLSWGSLQRTVAVNAVGTINLIEALQRMAARPPLLLVGSADQYGAVPSRRQPLRENAPCAPRSPYALSKLWQEEMGYYYHRLENWPIFLTRTFNNTGPGQAPAFVCSAFARQVALIEAGMQEPVMRVGNLQSVRDFLDVRDVVQAYRLIVEKGKPGVVYNVASGKKRKIAEVLDMLLDLTTMEIRVERDPAHYRPADIPFLLGDARRLRRATGWRPRYDLQETLSDLLTAWRGEVSGGKK